MPPHTIDKTDSEAHNNLPSKFKNPHAAILVSDLWAFGNHLNTGLERHLNSFKSDLVAWQHQIIASWNTMNVVVRVLQNKGLLSEEDVKRAGEELAREAKANHQAVKDATAKQERVKEADLIPTPIEVLSRQYKDG
jgi:hypothetical protein